MKIKIENVGRISKATIDLKRITMFLGKNDSGKTYAAASIWAAINYIFKLRSQDFIVGESSAIRGFIESFNDESIEGTHKHTVSPKELNHLHQKIIQSLNKNIRKTLEDAIGHDAFNASKLDITDINHVKPIDIHVEVTKVDPPKEEVAVYDEDQLENGMRVDIEIAPNYNVEISFLEEGIEMYSTIYRRCERDMVRFIVDYLVQRKIAGYSCFGRMWNTFESTYYLPAARTGIMIGLKSFVDDAMRRNILSPEEISEQQDLPAPIRRFASEVMQTGLSSLKQSLPISRILKGKVSRGKSRWQYMYEPEGAQGPIPLAATSSLVTEIAALSVLDRQLTRPVFLIFEEPEAHLHLEAQREMARVIAQMANMGAHILITTHSDTFIQQINNLITISDHPKREHLLEALNLSPNETIRRDSVSAYEFNCPNRVTSVTELKLTKTGFVAESLNDVLRKLAAETMTINEDLFDEDE